MEQTSGFMADGSDRVCNHSKGDTLKSKGRGCHIHMPLKETDFKFKGTGKWKGKSWGMIDPANGNRKRAGVSRINSKQNELEDTCHHRRGRILTLGGKRRTPGIAPNIQKSWIHT